MTLKVVAIYVDYETAEVDSMDISEEDWKKGFEEAEGLL